MIWYDVYVARAGDPAFSNESSNPSAHNCPDPVSPVLYDRACFDRVVEIGEQLDWGRWARVVAKAKVVEIFGHVRGERRMAEFLRTLEDNKRYAAVARET